MGMESDQEIVQMVGRDPRFSASLLPSIEECVSEGVNTQKQALDYLEAKVQYFRHLVILQSHLIVFLFNICSEHKSYTSKII
jgi:hypothetical protein